MRHQIAGLVAVVIARRQLFKVAEHIVTHLVFNAAGGADDKETPAEAPEHHRETREENTDQKGFDTLEAEGALCQSVNDLAGILRNEQACQIDQQQDDNAHEIMPFEL